MRVEAPSWGFGLCGSLLDRRARGFDLRTPARTGTLKDYDLRATCTSTTPATIEDAETRHPVPYAVQLGSTENRIAESTDMAAAQRHKRRYQRPAVHEKKLINSLSQRFRSVMRIIQKGNHCASDHS